MELKVVIFILSPFETGSWYIPSLKQNPLDQFLFLLSNMNQALAQLKNIPNLSLRTSNFEDPKGDRNIYRVIVEGGIFVCFFMRIRSWAV